MIIPTMTSCMINWGHQLICRVELVTISVGENFFIWSLRHYISPVPNSKPYMGPQKWTDFQTFVRCLGEGMSNSSMQPIALGSSYSTLLGCGYHFLSTVSGKRSATMAAIRIHVEYSVLTHGDGVQRPFQSKFWMDHYCVYHIRATPQIWSGWWFQPAPLKSMSSSAGMIIPNIWKIIKAMFHDWLL